MNADNEEAPDFRERIVVDPRILVGKPVVAGTRIPVSKILNLVAHGFTFSQIIDDYPALTEVDIRPALLYAGPASSGKRSSPSLPGRDTRSRHKSSPEPKFQGLRVFQAVVIA